MLERAFVATAVIAVTVTAAAPSFAASPTAAPASNRYVFQVASTAGNCATATGYTVRYDGNLVSNVAQAAGLSASASCALIFNVSPPVDQSKFSVQLNGTTIAFQIVSVRTAPTPLPTNYGLNRAQITAQEEASAKAALPTPTPLAVGIRGHSPFTLEATTTITNCNNPALVLSYQGIVLPDVTVQIAPDSKGCTMSGIATTPIDPTQFSVQFKGAAVPVKVTST